MGFKKNFKLDFYRLLWWNIFHLILRQFFYFLNKKQKICKINNFNPIKNIYLPRKDFSICVVKLRCCADKFAYTHKRRWMCSKFFFMYTKLLGEKNNFLVHMFIVCHNSLCLNVSYSLKWGSKVRREKGERNLFIWELMTSHTYMKIG